MIEKQIRKTHIRQQDQADCGVACLLSITKYYKGSATLENLRNLSGTSKQGTSLLGLFQASQALGFTAKGCEASINNLKEHNKPTILHVQKGQLEHYVVFYKYENDKFIIGDPAEGILVLNQSQLDGIWFSKRCLVLEPTIAFKQDREQNLIKFKWFLRLFKDDWNILGSSVVLGLALTVLGMATAVFSQKMIDSYIPSKNLNKFLLVTVFLFILLLSKGVLSFIRGYLLNRQNLDFNRRIVDYFFNSLLLLPKSFFDSRETGDMVARLNDTARIQRAVTQIIGNIFIDLLIVIVSFVVILFYSFEIASLTAIFIPIYFLVIFTQNKKIFQKQKLALVGYAKAESNYIDTIKGVSDIKSLNKQSSFGLKNSKIYGEYQQEIFNLGSLQLSLGFVYGILGILFTTLMLAIGGVLVIKGSLQLGAFMATFGLVSSLIPSVSNLALLPIPLSEARVAFERMFEFSNAAPESAQGMVKLNGLDSITYNNISFSFPGCGALIKDLNFTLKKGEVVALIGECGCGKSTIAQITERFYPLSNGNIIINNNLQLSEIEIYQWRQLVGYVPQNPHIFNGTIAENILFELDETNFRSLVEMLDTTGLMQYFSKFPMGLETLVGEKGINLSGGQIQMVALARAMVKNPQLLILDEATSAMDRETEGIVIKLIGVIKASMAILFITHRLNILRIVADRICVIENKKIETSGSHSELLNTDNFYSRYWNEILSQ